MKNINAQEYIDRKYPLNGACQRGNDPENKDKTREQITELDLSKGKLGKHRFYNSGENDKNLVGSLELEGFTNLRKLMISSHQITELDVSDCSNLEELHCQDNQLNSLNVTGCSDLYKINCSNNNLRELDLTTCVNLDEVDIKGCPKLTEDKIKSDLSYKVELDKLLKSGLKITEIKENTTRNILVIGITGNGKSALANTLSGTSVINKFEERDSATSVTKIFKKSNFEWEKDGKNFKFSVIDNIGFGDTNNVNEEIILNEIGKGIHAAKEGINQILFVFRGRFSPEHIIAYNMFKKFIAESRITEFTTIVRTGFKSFKNKNKVKEDKEILLAQNEELRKLIESCNGIIYVDNPSIPVIEIDSEDSEDEIEKKNTEKIKNEKVREKSRKIILDYLAENCRKSYKLGGWNNIYQKVDEYIKKKAEIEQSNRSTKEQELEQARIELTKTIKGSVGVSVPGLPVEFQAAMEYTIHEKLR